MNPSIIQQIWIISAIISFNPTLAHLPGPTPLDIGPLMFAQHIIGYLASLIGDLVMVWGSSAMWDLHTTYFDVDLPFIRHMGPEEGHYLDRGCRRVYWSR